MHKHYACWAVRGILFQCLVYSFLFVAVIILRCYFKSLCQSCAHAELNLKKVEDKSVLSVTFPARPAFQFASSPDHEPPFFMWERPERVCECAFVLCVCVCALVYKCVHPPVSFSVSHSFVSKSTRNAQFPHDWSINTCSAMTVRRSFDNIPEPWTPVQWWQQTYYVHLEHSSDKLLKTIVVL